jgi:hypothetical protein
MCYQGRWFMLRGKIKVLVKSLKFQLILLRVRLVLDYIAVRGLRGSVQNELMAEQGCFLTLIALCRCLILGLALLVITFLPASNLLFRVGFVIAERNLYLPSAGFCILVTMGMVHLSSYKQYRQVGLVLSVPDGVLSL